jgi:hypothetical protein
MSNVFQNVEKMWFGTKDNMQWIDTPLSGANVSTSGNYANLDLVNGGAHVRNSFDSHKNYNFTWGSSVDRKLASIIRAYRNGSYGRGLMYFIDPMYYETNILPQRWADPSMCINHEAQNIAGLVHKPSQSLTQSNNNGLPVYSAVYSFQSGVNYDGLDEGDALWIPIPPEAELVIWAYYSFVGNARIMVRDSGKDSNIEALYGNRAYTLEPVVTVVPGGVSGSSAELYLSNNASPENSRIEVSGITARIRFPGYSENIEPFWYTGEGHSGCAFSSGPSVFNNSGVGGGQVSLSCELKEVGSWA